MHDNHTDRIASLPTQAQVDEALNVLSAEVLFRGTRALVIEHDSDRYVLRITRNGKLILTK